MHCLTQNKVLRTKKVLFKIIVRALVPFVLVSGLLAFNPNTILASIQSTTDESGQELKRSLESLRDVEFQTWQVVAYQKDSSPESLALRIVGYPGTLRIDHPTPLQVQSGTKNWELEDITIYNSQLSEDPRQAAAEFNLFPLINQLRNNRPLRFKLSNVIVDLPIPPYVVEEWRSLLQSN